MTVIFGPDLSHYQQGIDLAKAAAEGHQFVLAKISQGASSRDPMWASYLAAGRKAGLLVAGYHYVTTDPPDKQAANCAAAIGDRSVAVALDWEANGGTWANFVAVLAAFRKAGLNVRLAYCPRWYWQQQGSPDMSAVGLPLWSSRYVGNGGAPAEVYKQVTAAQWGGYGRLSVGLVQFTDKATVAGKAVDCSAFGGTRDQLAALLGYTAGAPAPATTAAAAAVPEEDLMAPAPLPVTYLPDGRYRVAANVESTAIGSALYAQMWITYKSLWGDSTFTITALDAAGNVIDETKNDAGARAEQTLKNNVNHSYAVPAKAATVTIEGTVANKGDTEIVATLLAKPA